MSEMNEELKTDDRWDGQLISVYTRSVHEANNLKLSRFGVTVSKELAK